MLANQAEQHSINKDIDQDISAAQQPSQQENPIVDEAMPLLVNLDKKNQKEFVIEDNHIYRNSRSCFFNRVHFDEMLATINNVTLTTDFLVSIIASNNKKFDQYLEQDESLQSLVPAYFLIDIVVSMLYVIGRNRYKAIHGDQGRARLNVLPEDILLIKNVQEQLQNEALTIKNNRANAEVKANYITHVPTILINLGVHIAYAFTLTLKDAPDLKDNWLVNNYEWFAPVLMGSAMFLFSVLGSRYQSRQEKNFEERVNNYKL